MVHLPVLVTAAAGAIAGDLASDLAGLTYPSATKLKASGLSDAQVVAVQHQALQNLALTLALVGGGVALGAHLHGALGAAVGGGVGFALNYGRHRITL